MTYQPNASAGEVLLLVIICCLVMSCQKGAESLIKSSETQTEDKFNPPKLIKLMVKDFSEDLGLGEGELGGWRMVNSENRTTIIATAGDRISWTAGEDFALQFQFPEKLARNLFRTVSGDESIFNDRFTFVLEPGETLTVEVQNPNPESMQHLYELQYAVLQIEARELVEGDSPPRMIFMFSR